MVRSSFFKKIFGWAVFALLFLPGAARANFDLTIEIVDLQVTND